MTHRALDPEELEFSVCKHRWRFAGTDVEQLPPSDSHRGGRYVRAVMRCHALCKQERVFSRALIEDR